MWTAAASLGLALLADRESGRPRGGNNFGVGGWILMGSQVLGEGRIRREERVWTTCSFEEADRAQRSVNNAEEGFIFEDGDRDEVWKAWLHASRPGWVEDGFFELTWAFAVRRDSVGLYGRPSALPCQDPSVHTANRYTSKADYLRAFLKGDSTGEHGNRNGVAAWAFIPKRDSAPHAPGFVYPEFRATVASAFRYAYADKTGTVFPSRDEQLIARALRKREAEPFEHWLKMCLPGDMIADAFGCQFIIALSRDSTNSSGGSSYWEAPDI